MLYLKSLIVEEMESIGQQVCGSCRTDWSVSCGRLKKRGIIGFTLQFLLQIAQTYVLPLRSHQLSNDLTCFDMVLHVSSVAPIRGGVSGSAQAMDPPNVRILCILLQVGDTGNIGSTLSRDYWYSDMHASCVLLVTISFPEPYIEGIPLPLLLLLLLLPYLQKPAA